MMTMISVRTWTYRDACAAFLGVGLAVLVTTLLAIASL